MYGHVCRIWSHLANETGQEDDFILLLGDDIVLLDEGWREKIEMRFDSIEQLGPVFLLEQRVSRSMTGPFLDFHPFLSFIVGM